MKELQEKQRFKRLLYSWFSLVLLVIIVIILARGASAVMYKKHISAERIENLEKDTENLENRQAILENNIANLKTEEGIIEEIRKKFNVVREGEQVAIVVDQKSKASTTEAIVKNWYKKFWHSIINFKWLKQ